MLLAKAELGAEAVAAVARAACRSIRLSVAVPRNR